jgi:hypothetical protein
MLRHCVALCLAWTVAIGLQAPLAAAERHALLVGVSSMPALPRSGWLSGPRHDVPAMRNALLAQGFAPDHIVSLADGVARAGVPTRAAILDHMTRLGRTLRPGDVLVLYWSGHGLLLPGQPGLWQTPSGQQVHLLAQDARIDARSRQLVGAVSSMLLPPGASRSWPCSTAAMRLAARAATPAWPGEACPVPSLAGRQR